MRTVRACLVLALLASGCGKYGEPVRVRPPTPIEAPDEPSDEESETP